MVMLDNYKIMAANTSLVHGEVAAKLAQTNPFGLSWYKREDGKIVHSLRSTNDGIDVSAIAYRHGGGGHPHAAGFESTEMVIKEI
jgi:nanoRNase/pAp phosphatase (c-di-AMP/oligoRNAs hydrolase)